MLDLFEGARSHLRTLSVPAQCMCLAVLLITGLPVILGSVSPSRSLEPSLPLDPFPSTNFVSEPPFDPAYWARKAELFADDKSKITLLALEFLNSAAKKDAEVAKKDAEVAAAKKDAKKDAEVAAAKKDAEVAAAKKDAEVAAAKKDAEVAAAKKDAEKYRELLLKEEQTTIDLRKQSAKHEESDLRHKAAVVAVLANRNIIEIGLKSYGKATTFTKNHQHFLSEILVNSEGKLSSGPTQTLLALRNVSSSTPTDRDVLKELTHFEHELSKPLHNLRTATMTHLEGVLVGGDEPLCSALAVYIAELQKLKHISLLVTVINHNYDSICSIDGGMILPR